MSIVKRIEAQSLREGMLHFDRGQYEAVIVTPRATYVLRADGSIRGVVVIAGEKETAA